VQKTTCLILDIVMKLFHVKVLDAYKDSLSSLIESTTTAISEISPILAPKKRKRELSTKTNEAYNMSGSQKIKRLCNKSINVNNSYVPIYRDPNLEDISAKTIQHLVKNRNIQRSAKRMKKTIRN